MERPYRIVIAEDHTILRNGLISLLGSDDSFVVVGEAQDGRETIRCVENHHPDLVLLDLAMPRMNGIVVIKEVKKRFPKTKILVLTMHKTEEYVFEALRSGADGYCLKDSTLSELSMAMNSVLSGDCYLSPGISKTVLRGYLAGRKSLKSSVPWDTLTKRERQVLKLIGEGHTSKEIAHYLHISLKTAQKHRYNLMRKLDLHSVSALTSYAIERGLVKP
jgi:DNA-binding NarL/FixJ family response regulator